LRHSVCTKIRNKKETSKRMCEEQHLVGIAEFAGLDIDGVEQEETYILHTMK